MTVRQHEEVAASKLHAEDCDVAADGDGSYGSTNQPSQYFHCA